MCTSINGLIKMSFLFGLVAAAKLRPSCEKPRSKKVLLQKRIVHSGEAQKQACSEYLSKLPACGTRYPEPTKSIVRVPPALFSPMFSFVFCVFIPWMYARQPPDNTPSHIHVPSDPSKKGRTNLALTITCTAGHAMLSPRVHSLSSVFEKHSSLHVGTAPALKDTKPHPK